MVALLWVCSKRLFRKPKGCFLQNLWYHFGDKMVSDTFLQKIHIMRTKVGWTSEMTHLVKTPWESHTVFWCIYLKDDSPESVTAVSASLFLHVFSFLSMFCTLHRRCTQYTELKKKNHLCAMVADDWQQTCLLDCCGGTGFFCMSLLDILNIFCHICWMRKMVLIVK